MSKEYEKIEVRKQQQLTKKETFDFCLSSIKHRFFRSLLTLAVVVLAVAFFMYLLTENVLVDSLKQGVGEEIREARQGSRKLSLMFTKPTLKEFNSLLAGSNGRKPEQELISRVLSIRQSDVDKMAKIAAEEKIYLGFFNNIRIGQRKLLVGRRTDEDIFPYLQDNTNFLDFKNRLEPMGSIKFPGGYNKFTDFLALFTQFQAERNKLHAVWNEKIGKLVTASEKLMDNDSLKHFLATADSAKLKTWQSLVSRYGFDLSDQDLNLIVTMMKKDLLKERIINKLNQPGMRQKWRAIYDIKYGKMSEKLDLLDSAKVMKLLSPDFTAEELTGTAMDVRYEETVRSLEKNLNLGMPTEAGALFSGRNIYLLVLSFIVCMVGIANAMLMSITERFREIATLKCLGATDSFILIQIMIEAALQGFAGGVIGVLIGLVITVLKDTVLFGSRLFTFFPVSGVLIAVGASLVAGILLSVLASIYPSLKAARMAPMEAMRIE